MPDGLGRQRALKQDSTTTSGWAPISGDQRTMPIELSSLEAEGANKSTCSKHSGVWTLLFSETRYVEGDGSI